MSGKFLSTLKKAATTASTILTTKGDILSRSSSALGRLAVGSNNQVLTADSAQTLGVKWATAGGGATVTVQTDTLTANDTTTSTSYVSSSLSLTLPTRTGGFAFVSAVTTVFNANNLEPVEIVFFDDGTTTTGDQSCVNSANSPTFNGTQHMQDLDGSVMNLRFSSRGGATATLSGIANQAESQIDTFEVS